MNRRLLTCIVIVALAAAGLAAPAQAQKPIKIGVLTPLSPPGDAIAGQFIVRGAKMAVEDQRPWRRARRPQDRGGHRG